MSKHWNFKVFITEDGHCDFEKWRNSLAPQARVKIGIFINRLEVTEKWSPKHVKQLRGHSKILELRIKAPNVQCRPLGCYGPERKEFTLLVGAIEKGSLFIPKEAPKLAKERCCLISKDVKYTKDYE